MAALSSTKIASYLAQGQSGATTLNRGRALEELVCYIFGRVPGIDITHRDVKNTFNTEEIDVALWNDSPNFGFKYLPNIILVECKNWSKKVGSEEMNWFDSKLRNRGLEFGILVAALGITGATKEITAAHSIVAAALREKRRIVVVTAEELSSLADTKDLDTLIKLKICDLAVRGTL
jgi:hypothetical protein